MIGFCNVYLPKWNEELCKHSGTVLKYENAKLLAFCADNDGDGCVIPVGIVEVEDGFLKSIYVENIQILHNLDAGG